MRHDRSLVVRKRAVALLGKIRSIAVRALSTPDAEEDNTSERKNGDFAAQAGKEGTR